jgi:hypothetical protein
MYPFDWREFHGIFNVDEGPHFLKIFVREDGTRLKAARFAHRATCGFAPEVALPDVFEDITLAKIVPPFEVINDYAWVPDTEANGGCNPDTSDDCGSVQFSMICGSPDIVQFAFEVSAPNGNDGKLSPTWSAWLLAITSCMPAG